MPSPQRADEQTLVQASLLIELPSSHASPAWTNPSPHAVSDASVGAQSTAHAAAVSPVSHAPFPQQPTADQFFDEAQWESYRKLGRTVTQRVFGEGTGPALWANLADTYGVGG